MVFHHTYEPSDPPPRFDTLALLFSHFPIIARIAKLITTGDLIQLSRTSSTIRETLLQSPSYWEKLVGLTTLECSERDHVKGENVKGCRICSLPVCEACIVRSDFFGQTGTFSNRIRTFCDTCWAATDFSDTDLPEQDYSNHAPPVLCTCAARDGWLCSTCRAVERVELLENEKTCATDGCEAPHNSLEKHRVCTWCRHPLPPVWRLQGESPIAGRLVNGDGSGAFPLHPFPFEPEYNDRDARPPPDADTEGGKLKSVKSTDKIAGWDREDEDAKERYRLAWLNKGLRERERDMQNIGSSSRPHGQIVEDNGEEEASGEEGEGGWELVRKGEVGQREAGRREGEAGEEDARKGEEGEGEPEGGRNEGGQGSLEERGIPPPYHHI